MTKLDELANGNAFDGIRHSAKSGEFDQYYILIQFLNDGANLAFREMRLWQVFHGCHDIQ